MAAEADVLVVGRDERCTGAQTAALITQWPTRIQMLHIKDGINIASAGGSPRATRTGELDFRQIFAAARNRVRYYHQEHDSGTMTDADISFTNMKGQGPASVGTLLGLPPTFTSVPGGEQSPSVPVKIENTGDQPLTITNVTVQANAADAPSASDFTITSQNCTAAGGGTPLAPGNPAATPPVPRGTCTVNVAFRPTRSDAISVARLQFTSSSDDVTDRVLLAAKSSGLSQSVGGTVGRSSGCRFRAAASFGAFAPGVAQAYNAAMMAATVTHGRKRGPYARRPGLDRDRSSRQRAYALLSALQVPATNAANPSATFAPLLATLGSPATLLSYAGPPSGDAVTIGLRQLIAATEALLVGAYGKTLTFEPANTAP